MKNIYMVDTENVATYDFLQSNTLSENDEIILFASPNSRAVQFNYLQLLLSTPAVIKFENISVGTKNALDFQLVTYLSFTSSTSIDTNFYIVSNDRGFEVATNYLKEKYNVSVSILNPKNIIEFDNPINTVDFFLEIDSLLKSKCPKIKSSIIEEIELILNTTFSKSAIHNKLTEKFGKQGLEYYKAIKGSL